MENKLTIDQLKNYLGTGLKMRILDYKSDFVNIEIDELIGFHQWDKSGKLWSVLTIGGSKPAIDRIQPVCYRLSDLDKLIPELGFVTLKRLVNDDPKNDECIEIEIKNGKLKSLSRFQVYAWVEYEEGDSKREHIIDFYPYGNQGITPFIFIEKLFKWHFWPFGDEYFEQGLVIDKLKHGKEDSSEK